MAWNRTTREQYKREAVRYESDLTDAEWELIEPLIPKQGRMGRPRERDLREVFNRVQYQLATGCQWRALPNCFAPYSTVQNYFYNWRDSGLFDRMMEALWALARAGMGRNLEPTAAILDSQSVKTTDPKLQRSRSCPSLSGGPRGYDGAKKIKGRKRQLAVDVEGSPLAIQIHEGSVQDRDSAPGPEESDLRDPGVAGEGPDGEKAVCRWWLCRSETGGEVKEVGALRAD